MYSSIMYEMSSCAIRDTFTVKHTPIQSKVSRMVHVVSLMVQGFQGFPGSPGVSSGHDSPVDLGGYRNPGCLASPGASGFLKALGAMTALGLLWALECIGLLWLLGALGARRALGATRGLPELLEFPVDPGLAGAPKLLGSLGSQS